MPRKITFVFLVAAFIAATTPSVAVAQDPSVHFTVGGGVTAPNSEVRDRLGDGYNFNLGLEVPVTQVVRIEGLYSFNGLGKRRVSIPVSVQPVDSAAATPTDFFAEMNMQYGTGSVIVRKPVGTVRPYGLVGMGVYHRPVKVTTPALGYVPGYCDPWWYVCYPGGFVAVDNIVGERSSTDFGMDFGGGVTFGPVYAELRYHYIWGPRIEGQTVNPLSTGSSTDSLAGKNATGHFLATTVGIRF